MALYAPYSPCSAGIFWAPDTDSAFLMQSQTAGWGTVLVADTTDTINNVWPVLCASFNPPNAMALEVFDITDGLPDMDDLVETTYYPGADLADGNIGAYAWNPSNMTTQEGSIVDLFESIEDPNLTAGSYQPVSDLAPWPVDSTSFIAGARGNGWTYFFKVAGISGQHANQWITRLRHVWFVQRFSNGDDKASISVQSMLRINGAMYPGDSVTYSDEIAGGHMVTTEWYNNPQTGLPWTPNIVDNFDTGDASDYGFGWQASGTGVASQQALVFSSRVDVEAAPTDQRLAIGVLPASTPLQGWQTVALLDPNNSLAESPVTLVVANKYLWQWRLTRFQQGTGFGMAMCRLDEPGVELPGPPFWTSMNVPLDRQTHRLNGLGEEQSTVAGMLLETSGGFSDDSQFYAETAPTGLDTPNAWPDISAFFELSPIDIQHSFHQKFTPETTGDYGWFRIKCCTAVGTVLDVLRVLIFRISDGVHMAPIIRIDTDDLVSPNTEWQTVEFRVDDIPLVAGVQYAFAVFSATTHRQGWLVQVVNAGKPTGPPQGPPAAAWDVQWGYQNAGADDTLTIFNTQIVNPDPGTVWPATAELNFSTIPDGPGYFDAFAGDDTCAIQPVTIMWSSPDLPEECGGFLATEIERSDDDGVTWWPICRITDIAVGEFNDVEWTRLAYTDSPMPIYRARTFRGDGVPSDYTEEIPVDIDFGDRCGYWFTTNESNDAAVFMPDVGEGSIPPREYALPVERQVFTPLNRDYSIVFTGLEDRGSQFSATLKVRSGIVNTAGVPCVADACADYLLQGVDVFNPLLAICRGDYSYVCVRNEHGNRWFANVNVTTSKWTLPGEIFTAQVDIIPVTNRPSLPDAVAAS